MSTAIAPQPTFVPQAGVSLPAIECGEDIILDDFKSHKVVSTAGQNLQGGLYKWATVGPNGVSASIPADLSGMIGWESVSSRIRLRSRALFRSGTTQQLCGPFYLQAAHDTCFDMTNINALSFDVVGPPNASFSVRFFQKDDNCVRDTHFTPPGEAPPSFSQLESDSQVQIGDSPKIVVPLWGGSLIAPPDNNTFNWTRTGVTLFSSFTMPGTYTLSNIRLLRSCRGNGPTGTNRSISDSSEILAPPPAKSSSSAAGTAPTSAPSSQPGSLAATTGSASSGGVQVGAIVAAIAAAVFVVLLVAVALWFLRRRRRSKLALDDGDAYTQFPPAYSLYQDSAPVPVSFVPESAPSSVGLPTCAVESSAGSVLSEPQSPASVAGKGYATAITGLASASAVAGMGPEQWWAARVTHVAGPGEISCSEGDSIWILGHPAANGLVQVMNTTSARTGLVPTSILMRQKS
ncbi:hypothetical protein BDZ88DRAFT_15802 [Geranomyces variabilis]|nr:hypothetical protein BDZ88DRAFT_15802 [Geranomyces variabilis]KAJ3137311.1 hypothetical protein HDU90_002097 [Geranomyces variabilis]